MNRSALPALVAFILLLAPTGAAAAPVIQTSSAPDQSVTATLSWDNTQTADDFGPDVVRGLHLRIDRAGTTALDAPLTIRSCGEPLCRPFPLVGGADAPAVRVMNIDGDAEPEVLIGAFTGGAHCCTMLSVHDWFRGSYRQLQHDFGNGGVRIADIGRDGRVELRTSDDRFAYRFASYAASWRPIRILTLRSGRFIDVSRQYPALLRSDAAHAWSTARKLCRSSDPFVESLGLYAGWAANQYRLDRRAFALRALRQQERAGCFKGEHTSTFIRRLDTFLRRINRPAPVSSSVGGAGA